MSSKAKRLNALAALKAARNGGPRPTQPESDAENDVYDEVSEDEYRSIVRGRLMDDDFIEDDDGSGYVDNGMDDWGNGGRQGQSDEETEDEQDYFERTGRRKPKKKVAAKKQAGSPADYSRAGHKSSIAAAFGRQPALRPGSGLGPSSTRTAAASKASAMDAYRPAVNREKEDDFMARLMGGLDDTSNTSAVPASPSPAPRGSVATLANVNRKRKGHDGSFTNFRQSSSYYTGAGRLSSPSTGPPSSDPLDTPSDGLIPDVHISGSDTPPWGEAELIPEHGMNKKLRGEGGFARRIGSLGLNGSDSIASPTNVDEAFDRVKAAELSFVKHEPAASDDEDDLGLSIKAPHARDQSQPCVLVNTAGISVPRTSLQSRPLQSDAPPTTDVRQPPAVQRPSWESVHASLNVHTANDAAAPSMEASHAAGAGPSARKTGQVGTASPQTKVNAFEADRTLRFFWLDYTEHEGVVYLVGKVKDRESGKFVSCCLSVGGIERCLFVLPRGRVTREGIETDQVPSQDDVYDEFDALRTKMGVKSWLAKWVTRKYAFELKDVPSEGEYMKVKYGFDEPALPLDLSGSTFSHVFGTNTTAFELLVVKRGIMGPCWLNIHNATINTAAPLSWCKLEVTVDDPKDVSPFADSDRDAPRETPPLTVMSLSARTVVNHKENKREVVCASARVWTDMALEDSTPPEQLPCSMYTVVRPLGSMFPPSFEKEAKNGKSKIVTMKYERMLLNSLLAQIHLYDPDVIVGHEFNGVTLDVLLHRMRDLKAEHWSRIGRFRRAKWPKMKQGTNLKLTAGRLVCDLASDNGKSMIASTTWSLTEMCGTHLKLQREDIDPDETASYFDSMAPSPERLLYFVRHCECDTFFQMAIAAKVQILPLTKQLTNLAGNSWSKTLNGGRAERNEFILLHDFHRQKFICPDKVALWEKKAAAKAKAEEGAEDEEGKKAVASKKDKFKGGLVFEPKRGLWDKYILVMDFNSLYPSIIQEYNIDFTTVDRSDDDLTDVDRIPELPSSDVKQGVLPRLIATLVNRRRQVKSLMKDRNAAPGKLLQWNIKQQALKLTANSMYGCLGFENSRFYARPLAALTTFKGREILTHTKELAESLQLDVIYGDTDSVMINTNATEVSEAMRIGHEFKKAVNERYKLLEIDIDGVFQRMLLLQKKKYAALKVEEDGKKTTEIKGLDMKRREYSAISKNVSNYVLEQILSGDATETVVERIHEHLTQVGNDIRSSKIALDDFIIFKRLGKNPEDYPDAKSQPHVQVALRMKAKGGSARSGDVIPYIFCLGEDGSSNSKSAQADRAFHPDDMRRAGSTLAVDFEHYLALQILPPVERLCDSIEGTDRARLAECLGLDPMRYTTHLAASNAPERGFQTLDSQIPDEVRYRKCEALTFKCRTCSAQSTFLGLLSGASENGGMITPQGLVCSNKECSAPFGLPSLAVQLELRIRAHIARYYAGLTMCSEPSCGGQTRMVGVYGRRCLAPSCRGRTEAVYGDKALYTQLCFYESLLDAAHARERAKGRANYDEIVELAQRNAAELETLCKVVERYLEKCGRRYVSLSKVFSFMKV